MLAHRFIGDYLFCPSGTQGGATPPFPQNLAPRPGPPASFPTREGGEVFPSPCRRGVGGTFTPLTSWLEAGCAMFGG